LANFLEPIERLDCADACGSLPPVEPSLAAALLELPLQLTDEPTDEAMGDAALCRVGGGKLGGGAKGSVE
jgi:hypothetical protein